MSENLTVKELYEHFDKLIPNTLSCDWDNDGAMCISDPDKNVKKVLLTLDVTDAAVEYAVKNRFDVIISHHPLIFKPLKAVNGFDIVSKKVIRLIKEGISVFSFHTRLDALDDGVNDRLAALIGIKVEEKLAETPGDVGLGRVGTLSEAVDFEKFASDVRAKLGGPINFVKNTEKVSRVALVGGDGKDFIKAAAKSGADTYITGAVSYNTLCDASEAEMNIIEAGHFFTENPVLGFFADSIEKYYPEIIYEKYCSNPVLTLT